MTESRFKRNTSKSADTAKAADEQAAPKPDVPTTEPAPAPDAGQPEAPEDQGDDLEFAAPEKGQDASPSEQLQQLLANNPDLMSELQRQLFPYMNKMAQAQAVHATAAAVPAPVDKVVEIVDNLPKLAYHPDAELVTVYWLGEYYAGKGDDRRRVTHHHCYLFSPAIEFKPGAVDATDPRPHAAVPVAVAEYLLNEVFDAQTDAPQFGLIEDAPAIARTGTTAGRFARRLVRSAPQG